MPAKNSGFHLNPPAAMTASPHYTAFDDTTGRSVDLNFHGSVDDVLARVAQHQAENVAPPPSTDSHDKKRRD